MFKFSAKYHFNTSKYEYLSESFKRNSLERNVTSILCAQTKMIWKEVFRIFMQSTIPEISDKKFVFKTIKNDSFHKSTTFTFYERHFAKKINLNLNYYLQYEELKIS